MAAKSGKKTKPSAKTEDILALVRGQYKKITPQRLEILRVLILAAKPLSASDIHKRAAKTHPSISLDTVYRNLLALSEAGLVSHINLKNRAKAQFEFQGVGEHHHHAVCISCEKIFCIDQCVVKIEPPSADAGFEILGHAFEVYGKCSKCN